MEHFVVRLAAAQRARGHDARIAAIKSGPLVAKAEALGIPTTVIDRGKKADRIVRAAGYFLLTRPDIIHAHNPTSLHYAILARAASLGRIVFTDHNGMVRVPRAIEWRVPHAIVGVSKATADTCGARRAGREVLVIHNGIDVAAPKRSRDEVRRELGIGDGVTGIHVARLVDLKAQDVLIRAIGLLRDRGVLITMLLVGDGPERQKLEALCKELNLGPDRVRFLGFRDDVNDLYAASDFFSIQSRTEGLPLSVLEAMAQKLPVVSTKVGGIAEVCLPGAHGLFVDVDDAAALSSAIETLTRDPARREAMGRDAEAHVRSGLTFEGMTSRYDDLYERVLRGRIG